MRPVQSYAFMRVCVGEARRPLTRKRVTLNGLLRRTMIVNDFPSVIELSKN